MVKFDIIICDIQGVGKNFGSKYEGGHLIKEINNKYPLKYLVAFSGKSFDMTYNQFFSLCDTVMQKHADISEWTGCLDKATINLSDPIYIWKKARKMLLENQEDLNLVSKLEQAYLKSIVKNNKDFWNKTTSKSNFNYGNSVATIDALGTYISLVLQLLAA